MCAGLAMRHSINPQVAFAMEVSGYLVGSAAFKAVGTSDPRPAGSIPVHLRHIPGSMSTIRNVHEEE